MLEALKSCNLSGPRNRHMGMSSAFLSFSNGSLRRRARTSVGRTRSSCTTPAVLRLLKLSDPVTFTLYSLSTAAASHKRAQGCDQGAVVTPFDQIPDHIRRHGSTIRPERGQTIECITPELAFVPFTIMNDVAGLDVMAAWSCIRLDRLESGYRRVHLVMTRQSI